MTKQELKEMVVQMEKTFDIVRLLDKDMLNQMIFDSESNTKIIPCKCYEVWDRDERCDNCVTKKAFDGKCQKTKLEIIDSMVYQVVAKYIEVEGIPYVMEMILCLDEDALVGEDGEKQLLKKLTDYNEMLYTDVLTKAYNRRYYEDKLKHKHIAAGVAMIDLDDFKIYNDTYGHRAGDIVLKTTADIIGKSISDKDMLIRFGGDEFLLVIPETNAKNFVEQLQKINNNIKKAQVDGFSQIRLTVSIGGALSEGEAMEKTICKADSLMYKAKKQKDMVITERDVNGRINNFTVKNKTENARKILIADSSSENRKRLIDMLSTEYGILEAEDGEQCMEAVKKYGSNIAMVLLEVDMPKINGFDVLSLMNEYQSTDEVPVVMISDNYSEEVINKAYEYGVADYIRRDFTDEIIHKRITNTIKLYAKQRRLINLMADQVYEKEKNNRMLISILSKIVELRNGESGIHILHINILTGMLLEKLAEKTDKYNLSWADRLTITTASSLHDIGKIGIDERILNKSKAECTVEERQTVKSHTLIGASILNNLNMYEDEALLKNAYEICRWHHERYDGKGYPDGLVGEEIPIAAQVVSLADAFDVMIINRSNEKTYSVDEAIDSIERGERGTFNPVLIECLRELRNRIKEEIILNDTVADTEEEMKKEIQEYENTKEKFVKTMIVNRRKKAIS